MQQCYADDAVFSDPVFQQLNAAQVRKMWEMLIKRGSDLQLVFDGIEADDKRGRAHWVATYTFSTTGKKVVNDIHAEFEFENGKIKRHTDKFGFYRWARQAFGLPGRLFGWTEFLKASVRIRAMKNLTDYMQRHEN